MESFPLLIGCSELHRFMADPGFGLTDIQARELETLILKDSKSKKRKQLEAKRDFIPDFDISKGAKTAIEEKVEEYCFGYRVEVNSNAMTKGTIMEDDAIGLLNTFRLASYKKNEDRKEEGFLKGTCDIHYTSNGVSHIIDIKCAETWKSMPQLKRHVKKEGEANGYFWQGIGYMYLWEASTFELCYCMLSTPLHLIPYGTTDFSAHVVSPDTEIKYQISTYKIERDEKVIEQMLYRLKECKKYADFYYNELINK